MVGNDIENLVASAAAGATFFVEFGER